MKTLITFLFALLCATPAWAQPRPQPLPDARGLLRALEDAFTAVADRVAFDADALPAALTVRRRRAGERFTPFGSGERRLKTFLIDAKVPRWERDRVPIVEAGGAILWVGGLRRGAQAPVAAATRRVLELALSAPVVPR